MTKIPKPASPLPWDKWDAAALDGVKDAGGNPIYWTGIVSTGIPWMHFHNDDDRAYLVWAANNALALYEMLEKIDSYLNENDRIAANSDAHEDIAKLLKAARGREMTNWTKVENDPPAVLRALADGKKVRYCKWLDHAFIHLLPPGCIVNEKGVPSDDAVVFTGTWFIEAPRDIATDPQVGDEFMWNLYRAKVVAVIDGFVFFHDGHTATGRGLREWAGYFDSGAFERIEADKQ